MRKATENQLCILTAIAKGKHTHGELRKVYETFRKRHFDNSAWMSVLQSMGTWRYGERRRYRSACLISNVPRFGCGLITRRKRKVGNTKVYWYTLTPLGCQKLVGCDNPEYEWDVVPEMQVV